MVISLDGASVARQYAGDPSSFTYIGPPYVEVWEVLPNPPFTYQDHAQLAKSLDRCPDGNWIVTYDPFGLYSASTPNMMCESMS